MDYVAPHAIRGLGMVTAHVHSFIAYVEAYLHVEATQLASLSD
jgi:hypothetical protein